MYSASVFPALSSELTAIKKTGLFRKVLALVGETSANFAFSYSGNAALVASLELCPITPIMEESLVSSCATSLAFFVLLSLAITISSNLSFKPFFCCF